MILRRMEFGEGQASGPVWRRMLFCFPKNGGVGRDDSFEGTSGESHKFAFTGGGKE